MSVNAMSGLSGTGLVPLTPASTPTKISASQSSADAGLAAIKPAPPVLRVPTDPLTPAVLAQLIGRKFLL